ncbi:MAG TPA: Tn3 family transposase [Bryobacteraceae bacterium]|nr:Tn3 family transposase [Bryobacteraceae bacterium]
MPARSDGQEKECKQYLESRAEQLRQSFETVDLLAREGQLPEVRLDGTRLRISPLKRRAPDDISLWSGRAYDLLPRIHITNLLMEVDSWTGFSRCFTHLLHGDPARDRSALMAVILADATNLGLSKMAVTCSGHAEGRLHWMSDWHVRDETYAKALAEIVNRHHRTSLASHWGSGTTSSSDGQAFPIATRKPVTAHTNAKYGRDPVVMFYTHISDRYAPFHSKVITATIRDATHVLDGLLDHGTDVTIREHYTDTAGFTDHVFALCHLLGFRFAPRIRGLHDRRLYTLSAGEYKALTPLISGKINARRIEKSWDELKRLTASIQQGSASASLLVNKLGAYSRHN